ncbi:PREDICTED: zinc finger protein 862-like, partial [Amphimedon queenslandica]
MCYQDQSSTQHQNCSGSYRESLHRRAKRRKIDDLIHSEDCLTVDGEAFCDALRCIYFLAKNETPHTTNFVPLHSLCVQLGNTTLPRLLLEGKNRTYPSEQTMKEMMEAIGSAIEEFLLKNICASPFYSIILDESTDLSTVKQLGLVVQYLDMETATAETKYLKLIDLSPAVHATADVIVKAVTAYLEEKASPAPGLQKLIGAASDGASVMVGRDNGVIVQLKIKVPGLIATHCSAHRLALAASDAAHTTPWFARFERILNQVYSFFSRSAVHTAELVEIQRMMDHPKLKLKKPSETRWLSLENAVSALRCCYRPVKAVLENEAAEGDATALGLHTQLKKPEFIVNIHFLCDVLDTVGSLSKAFQSNQVNLLGIENLVKEKLSVLEELQNDIYCGGYMLTVIKNYPEELAAVKETNFDTKAACYIKELISSIRNRFPNIRLITLLGHLHPKHVAEATPAIIFELASSLSLNGPNLWNEFMSYKSFALSLKPMSLHQSVLEMWHPDRRDTMVAAYPLISQLLAQVIVLPASSAEVERVFSTINRTKTPLRNHLTTMMLDNLIRISMDGPEC